jgi:hypothetical protein
MPLARRSIDCTNGRQLTFLLEEESDTFIDAVSAVFAPSGVGAASERGADHITAFLGLADYSQVDMWIWQCESVNFGAGKKLVSPHRLRYRGTL